MLQSFNLLELLGNWVTELSVALLLVLLKTSYHFLKRWLNRDRADEEVDRYVGYLDQKTRDYNAKYQRLLGDVRCLLRNLDEIEQQIKAKNQKVLVRSATLKGKLHRFRRLRAALETLQRNDLIENAIFIDLVDHIDKQIAQLQQMLFMAGLEPPFSLWQIRTVLRNAYIRISNFV